MAAVEVAEKEAAATAEVKVDAEMPAAADASAETGKRKEPEGEKAVQEPEAKKQKADEGTAAKPAAAAPDAAVVKKQVEYYMSDENLRHDKFFHEKISTDPEGWLEMGLILSCNKMKAMRASREDVLAALKGSTLELKDGGSHVRRPGNAALPKLEAKPVHNRKNQAHAHSGGVIGVFRNVPAEQSWVQIKEKLTAHIAGKAKLWHVSEVNEKAQCFFVCAPFDGDMAFFQETELELEGAKLKVEICYGELLQSYLRTMPKFIREKREKELRRRQKERNQPFLIGSQKFMSIGALRGKVKEIMNSRSDGEALKPEGTDFKLIRALMEFHPKGAEKTKGVVGIKVQPSSQGDNRCFWIVREDESSEDISMKKCIDAVEQNPPTVPVEKPDAKKAEGKKEEAKPDSAEAKPEDKAEEKSGANADEVKSEVKADEKTEGKAEEANTEAKAEEPAKEAEKPAEA